MARWDTVAPTSGIPENPKFKLNLSPILSFGAEPGQTSKTAAEEHLGAEFGASIMAVHKASSLQILSIHKSELEYNLKNCRCNQLTEKF
ncbi:unnamed protein product [Calypogeia fissa]